MIKKKEIKKTTSNITPWVEKRIIELHQKDKLGAQAIADKLSKEFNIKFSGKRLVLDKRIFTHFNSSIFFWCTIKCFF